ncbi:MAG: hypothetical protein JRG93_19145, partial [Deltaproteobacteria bacterium]|nr:hypothetical protein [Deltaproteobacteria bacterium]
MRKLFLIALFTLTLALSKLDIKAFIGIGGTTYVSMLETGRERDLFGSYEIGFGARLRRGKAFIEALFSFNRWIYEGTNPTLGGVKTQVNSFELPFLAGYIPRSALSQAQTQGRQPRHLPGHRPLRHKRGPCDVQSGLELFHQPQQRDDNLVQNGLPPGATQPRVRLLAAISTNQSLSERERAGGSGCVLEKSLESLNVGEILPSTDPPEDRTKQSIPAGW